MGDEVSISEITLGADAVGMRLDRALAIAIPTLSRERLKALISSGNVSDDSGRLWRDPAVKAQPGQILRVAVSAPVPADAAPQAIRSEEHTSELQYLMSISYAVFCLKKKQT